MIPIEFHAKVACAVTNNCESRAVVVETIERAAQDVQYADASRTDQKEFWRDCGYAPLDSSTARFCACKRDPERGA
jgi:hypothetical protein